MQVLSDAEQRLRERVQHFLTRGSKRMFLLPHLMSDTSFDVPTIPTALDTDLMLLTLREASLLEARCHYSTVTNHKCGVHYLSTRGSGSSSAEVFSIKSKHDLRRRGFVAKSAIMEKMPSDAARAHRSIVEMSTSIIAFGNADMVCLDTVHKASDILMGREPPLLRFRDDVVSVPLAEEEIPMNRQNNSEEPTDSDLTVGMGYFDLEFLVAAIRLLTLIKQVGEPAGFDGEWDVEVGAAFKDFVTEAADFGINEESVLRMRVPRGPRSFGHERNKDHINDLVAGRRAAFMVETRVATAFSYVHDFFGVPIPNSDNVVLHLISPRHDTNLIHAMGNVCGHASRPTPASLQLVRGFLAQILLTLEAAQTLFHFVHYDLHAGNVLVDVVGSGDPERSGATNAVWKYVRPNGHPFYIWASDTNGQAARIIDFGRTRCDDPRYPGLPQRACFIELDNLPPSAQFDSAIDMRSLAHDIVVWCLAHWCGHIHTEAPELMEVLECMSGIKTWMGLKHPNAYKLTGGARLDNLESMEHYTNILASGALAPNQMKKIRDAEFITPRSEIPTHDPTDVLNLPFFEAYRSPPQPNQAVVIDVADAHLSPIARVTPPHNPTGESVSESNPLPPGSTSIGKPKGNPRPTKRAAITTEIQ